MLIEPGQIWKDKVASYVIHAIRKDVYLHHSQYGGLEVDIEGIDGKYVGERRWIWYKTMHKMIEEGGLVLEGHVGD